MTAPIGIYVRVSRWLRCGDRDRIVGRPVTCQRHRFHRGPHRMDGARWKRGES